MKTLKSISFILILAAVLAFVAYEFGYINVRQFPKAEGLKQVTLNCDYHGQKLALQENLYQSIDNFYKSDPKKRRLPYKDFVYEDSQDKTLEEVTQKIEQESKDLGLTDDQTADLATCFVQNIPYDNEKAKVVLSSDIQSRISKITDNSLYDRYPYETLYDDTGICTDKSYLEAAILERMGYGASLMTFDSAHHMAAGIKAPPGYDSFNTGYAYIETTNTGYKVGQLPIIDQATSGAKSAELNKLSGDNYGQLLPQIPDSNFPPPTEVIKIADGSVYQRIVEIAKENARLKEIINSINSDNQELGQLAGDIKNSQNEVQSAKNSLDQSEAQMNQAKAAYESNPSMENYQAYNQAYQNYQSVYQSTKSVIDGYNQQVDQYNQLVKEMNGLIDEYNTLIKK